MSKCTKSSDGHIDAKAITAWWQEYVQDLFDDDQPVENVILETTETSLSILKSEIRWALG